ncbi:putative gamma-cysteine synthetase regulatory subunit [Gigaspora margarita]|uniref:GCS light chain n=1 Tax=Gigaspora margarita TaxID=4874 RepID=A0A8H4AAI0_GIGMA|nr:putative gamma-cysteine synthetase regulatory subunit [Gigaspora margarita]
MSFPDINTVIIYTGNVMKQANINTFKNELASCLENSLKNVHTSYHIDQTRGILEVPSPYDQSFKLKDRNDFEITDSFIVYFNGLLFDDQEQDDSNLVMDDFEALVEVWKELEFHYGNDRIKKLGVSEFTKNRFERFLNVVEVLPKIDQINFKSCCDLPSKMINYAKEHDIELLTHKDPTDILPSTTFQKILKDTKFSFTSELLPRWVLKYSVLVKCREVVANKGYIVMSSTPIADSNFKYPVEFIE